MGVVVFFEFAKASQVGHKLKTAGIPSTFEELKRDLLKEMFKSHIYPTSLEYV